MNVSQKTNMPNFSQHNVAANQQTINNCVRFLKPYGIVAMVLGLVAIGLILLACIIFMGDGGVALNIAVGALTYIVLPGLFYILSGLYFVKSSQKMQNHGLTPSQLRSATTNIIILLAIQAVPSIAIIGACFMGMFLEGRAYDFPLMVLIFTIFVLGLQAGLIGGMVVVKRGLNRRFGKAIQTSMAQKMIKTIAWVLGAYTFLLASTVLLLVFDQIVAGPYTLHQFGDIKLMPDTFRWVIAIPLLVVSIYYIFFIYQIWRNKFTTMQMWINMIVVLVLMILQLLFTMLCLSDIFGWMPQGAIVFVEIVQAVVILVAGASLVLSFKK